MYLMRAFVWMWTLWIWAAAASAVDSSAVTMLTAGGVLRQWIVVAPVAPAQAEAVDREAPGVASVSRMRAIARLHGARVMHLSDDGAGVDLDTVALVDSNLSAYAFCHIEAFDTVRYHGYLASAGAGTLWVNGRRIASTSDSGDQRFCLPGTHFSVRLHEGLNTAVLKTKADARGWRYSLRLYRHPDSLAAYWPFLDSLAASLTPQQLSLLDDTLSVTVSAGVGAPAGSFHGELTVSAPDSSVIAAKPFAVGRSVQIALPASCTGLFRVSARLDSSVVNGVQGRRYGFRGDFRSTWAALRDTALLLQTRVRALTGRTSRNHLFARAIGEKAIAWILHQTGRMSPDSLDSALPQYAWAIYNERIVRAFIAKGDFPTPATIPVYLEIDSLPAPLDSLPFGSSWLRYKYPDRFAAPREWSASAGFQAWVYLPENTFGRGRLPLIVSLHDAGRRGRSLANIRECGPLRFVASGNQLDAVTLAPLYEGDSWWPIAPTSAMIRSIAGFEKVHPRRVYLAGWGMGGFAVWDLAARFPSLSAALAVASAGGDPRMLCELKTTPMRIYHALNDPIVGIDMARDMYRALVVCGANHAELIVHADGGHTIEQAVFSSEPLYRWLLRHRRR